MNSGELRVDVDGNVVRVVGELDVATAPLVTAGFRLAERSEVRLDLSGLTFIDVRGLDAVVDAVEQLRGAGHAVRVVGATGLIRRVFELTGHASLLSD